MNKYTGNKYGESSCNREFFWCIHDKSLESNEAGTHELLVKTAANSL